VSVTQNRGAAQPDSDYGEGGQDEPSASQDASLLWEGTEFQPPDLGKAHPKQRTT
jgi:hypothetical protein